MVTVDGDGDGFVFVNCWRCMWQTFGHCGKWQLQAEQRRNVGHEFRFRCELYKQRIAFRCELYKHRIPLEDPSIDLFMTTQRYAELRARESIRHQERPFGRLRHLDREYNSVFG